MKRMSKCSNCMVQRRVQKSAEPACCVWYMDHVVILGESTENCTEFEPIETDSEEGNES